MAETDVKIKLGVTGDAQAKKKLKGIGTSMENMSSKFKKSGTIMLGVGTALAGSMLALTNKWADAGDEVAKMAKRTGWQVESLSELKHVADISGTSLQAFEKSSRKLSMAIVDAAEGGQTYEDALNRIGLTGAELMGLGIEDQFWAVANALADVEDDTIKAATAMELFGRSGTELFPMLEEGSEGIAALRQEAHDLGIVFDEESAAKAEEFKDAMTRLKTSMAGVGAEIAQVLAPELTKLIDKATAVITRIKEWTAAHPELVKWVKGLVIALVGGGGLLLAFSQISRAIILINTALAIFHGLAGPAGWIKLGTGMAVAAGALVGMNKLMGGMFGGAPGYDTHVRVNDEWIPRSEYKPLASGGIVTGPTRALIGEAGPEAVVPLGKGMATNINVTVQGSVIGQEALADVIYEQLLARKARDVTLELG